jgi:methionyl-tRNA formyltransferase
LQNFFSKRKSENIVALYFEKQSAYSEYAIEILGQNPDRVFYGKQILYSSDHIYWLIKQNVDFVITVYWPWLLGKEYLDAIKDSVNFHPSLLPINRGWYPHVHSIIDGSPAGVTLHKISKKTDKGDIWIQREIKIQSNECAKEIYIRLQSEMVKIFIETWDKISTNQIKATKQDSKKSVYHSKNELSSLDKIELDHLTGRQLFNLLRARSFGQIGGAYFKMDGRKYYLNLRISKNKNFKDNI